MSASIDMGAVTMAATGTVAQTPSPALVSLQNNVALLEAALATAKQLNTKAITLLNLIKGQLDAAVTAGNNDPAILALAARIATDTADLVTGNTSLNNTINADTPAT